MNVAPVDLSRRWDVAIIGSGMGGATAAWVLASHGLSVLLLERGGRVATQPEEGEPQTEAERLARGWWPHPLSQQRSDGKCERFFAPVGCAIGGSSVHYGAALERMAASDFESLQTARQYLPAWPVSFDEFAPFYQAVESLYGLRPADPGAEQRLSAWDLQLMGAMRRNGLQPDLLHVAMSYDEQCEECVGKICPRGCKADARTACLEKAVRTGHCEVLEHCEVQTLEADDTHVHVIHARHQNQDIEVRARTVVLAAGALHSPQILLRSSNSRWPNGLANRSDQVGRNLMFHTADIFALWAPRRIDRRGRQKKSLSVRDFYVRDGQRLGYVQSMGLDAGRGAIAVYLKDVLRRRGIRSELLLRLVTKLPSHLFAKVLGNAGIFAAMTEDDPSPDNRLILDPGEPDGARFTYTITDDLRARATALRQVFARGIRPWRLTRLSTNLDMNYGHPCGTCRFGTDPAISVLDRDCKAHDLDNLYVLDASFMPRSGAVNPSLTIAANAMRVAQSLAQKLARPGAS